MDYITKQQAAKQKDQMFPSEGARKLDAAYKEVDFVGNSLAMTLMLTR